jgi:lipid-A-disaccharide synthase
VVPEFLQERCAPARIAPALLALMADPQARAAQLAAFARVIASLGQGGEPPSVRAAHSVLRVLGQG